MDFRWDSSIWILDSNPLLESEVNWRWQRNDEYKQCERDENDEKWWKAVIGDEEVPVTEKKESLYFTLYTPVLRKKRSIKYHFKIAPLSFSREKSRRIYSNFIPFGCLFLLNATSVKNSIQIVKMQQIKKRKAWFQSSWVNFRTSRNYVLISFAIWIYK